MRKIFRLQGLQNISIAKKLYFIVGAMALLIVIELLTLWFSVHALSSVRALVGAEGLWSKAEKDGVYHLEKYYRTHDEKDYEAFQKFMEVPNGDHKARLELIKASPNLDTAREGFLEGRVHPDDIDGVLKILMRFHDFFYIKKAIGYWAQGDSLIAQLAPIGEKLHAEISSGAPSKEKLDAHILELEPLNQQLTRVEDDFSFTLGEGSRWLENVILKLLFGVALTVEITGLVLTVSVSRAITKGLDEINRAATNITGGDLDDRATVFSKDEIGMAATAINQMTEQLILSNRELEQFAYLASHDLQEPLRKLMLFTGLLEDDPDTVISEKGKSYIEKISQASLRMQRLVTDVLEFSQLNISSGFQPIDLNVIIAQLVSDMEPLIEKFNAQIHVAPIPVIEGSESQLRQLFQNLISNAIKFNKGNPVIEIYSEIITGAQLPEDYLSALENRVVSLNDSKKVTNEKFCRLYVKDNGIGFDEKYHDKIFVIFQRLHGKQTYEGTGIGLAICKKIVGNHNGIISANSKPGEGATFVITIPVSQKGK
jgi:signal transduction histidine kinase